MELLMMEARGFVLVGVGATTTHWLAVVMCVEWLCIRPLVANIAGWFIAFIVSFMGHYLLTFRHLSARWTIALRRFFRSEERRVGKEGVSAGRFGWGPAM